MDSSLARLVNSALPSVQGVTYNPDKNIFLTSGYTSAAGNTYFQGIRLSDRLAIVMNIGEGYAHTFLNGLQLFCFDGRNRKLIGSREYNTCFFDEDFAKKESMEILLDYMKSQARMRHICMSDYELKSYAKAQIAATISSLKQIANN